MFYNNRSCIGIVPLYPGLGTRLAAVEWPSRVYEAQPATGSILKVQDQFKPGDHFSTGAAPRFMKCACVRNSPHTSRRSAAAEHGWPKACHRSSVILVHHRSPLCTSCKCRRWVARCHHTHAEPPMRYSSTSFSAERDSQCDLEENGLCGWKVGSSWENSYYIGRAQADLAPGPTLDAVPGTAQG